jgi:hypothetical protein
MTTHHHHDDIVGYTFNADNYCPSCIVSVLPTGEGEAFDGWALAEGAAPMSTEDNLTEIAVAFGIDRMTETSFDSDEFPKVIFRYHLDINGDVPTEVCGKCAERLDGLDEAIVTEDDFDEDDSIAVVLDGLVGRPSVMDTIIQFAGTRQGTDERVVVAVDHRPAHDIIAALCDEDEILVYAEAWQLRTLHEDEVVLHPVER